MGWRILGGALIFLSVAIGLVAFVTVGCSSPTWPGPHCPDGPNAWIVLAEAVVAAVLPFFGLAAWRRQDRVPAV
jgi:hypothetical protein